MKAIPTAPTPTAIFNEALAFHQAGQIRQATALYRQLLQVQPHNADVIWLLGSIECQLGHLEQGAALLERLRAVGALGGNRAGPCLCTLQP